MNHQPPTTNDQRSTINHPQKTVRCSFFSLIEILVALVILSSVIILASVSYKNQLLSSEKSHAHLSIDALLPLVKNAVDVKLKQGELSGQGELDDLTYTWQAKTLDTKKTAVAKMAGPSRRFDLSLLHVSLQVQRYGLSQKFQYRLTVWKE